MPAQRFPDSSSAAADRPCRLSTWHGARPRRLPLPELLAACFFLSSALAQPHGTLAGQILDGTASQAVARARVMLCETGAQRFTDEQGRFAFAGLRHGRYRLAVHHLAYADAERSCLVEGGRCDTIRILLQPALLPSGEVLARSTHLLSPAGAAPYPVSITAGERLRESRPATAPEALKGVPGIALARDGVWETAVSIRGLGRSHIVSLLDNARIETSSDLAGALSLVNVHDLERIETVRSPGTVLYGTGALGGVIHLMTRQPDLSDVPGLHAELISDLAGVNASTAHYLALEESSGGQALRVSAGYRRAGNTATPEGPIPNSQFRDYSVSGSLRVRTGQEQSLLLSYQRVQAEDAGIPGGAPLAAPAVATYRLARRELMALTCELHNLSSWLPSLSLRASGQTIARNVEIRQSPLLRITPHAVHGTVSLQIISLIAPWNDALLTVGLEAWQRQLDSRRERFTPSGMAQERPLPPARFFSGGVFAQHEWQLLPGQLTLTLGMRYDRIRCSNEESPQGPLPDAAAPAGTPVQPLWPAAVVRDHAWSAGAGIRCSLGPSVEASLLAAAAFRAPSLEERYQHIDLGSVLYVGSPSLRSERSLSLNAGLRVHREDGSRAQADAFVNFLTDLVAQLPGTCEGRAAYLSRNIGKARLYGVELSGELPLAATVALAASASYVRGEDTYHRASLPEIAPLRGELAVRWRLPEAGTVHLSCSWAAAQNLPAPGEARTPGYGTLDVEIASRPLPLGSASLTLRSGLQNLLDRSYRNHLSTLRGVVRSEPGRNFFLSAAVEV